MRAVLLLVALGLALATSNSDFLRRTWRRHRGQTEISRKRNGNNEDLSPKIEYEEDYIMKLDDLEGWEVL